MSTGVHTESVTRVGLHRVVPPQPVSDRTHTQSPLVASFPLGPEGLHWTLYWDSSWTFPGPLLSTSLGPRERPTLYYCRRHPDLVCVSNGVWD